MKVNHQLKAAWPIWISGEDDDEADAAKRFTKRRVEEIAGPLHTRVSWVTTDPGGNTIEALKHLRATHVADGGEWATNLDFITRKITEDGGQIVLAFCERAPGANRRNRRAAARHVRRTK